jgi:hypothetical protein
MDPPTTKLSANAVKRSHSPTPVAAGRPIKKAKGEKPVVEPFRLYLGLTVDHSKHKTQKRVKNAFVPVPAPDLPVLKATKSELNRKRGGGGKAKKKAESPAPSLHGDCPICARPYTKGQCGIRSKIVCNNAECKQEMCADCAKTYILGLKTTAHCMGFGCRREWDPEFMEENFSSSFIAKYRKHVCKIDLEAEKARLQEVQPIAERRMHCIRDVRKLPASREVVARLERELRAAKARMGRLEERAADLKYNSLRPFRQGTGASIPESGGTETAAAMRPCPSEGCRGFLGGNWKCPICNNTTCSKCHVVLNQADPNDGKGGTAEEKAPTEHKCNPEDIKSVKAIEAETRPCPRCGTRIFKISGCDQMWCTVDHVAFSWSTGEEVRGVIHNPHYFQWQREMNDGVAPRVAGDRGGAGVNCAEGNMCGGQILYREVDAVIKALVRAVTNSVWSSQFPEKTVKLWLRARNSVEHMYRLTGDIRGVLRMFGRVDAEENGVRELYRVKYVTAEIGDAEWARRIKMWRKKSECRVQHRQILNTLMVVVEALQGQMAQCVATAVAPAGSCSIEGRKWNRYTYYDSKPATLGVCQCPHCTRNLDVYKKLLECREGIETVINMAEKHVSDANRFMRRVAKRYSVKEGRILKGNVELTGYVQRV